MLDSSTPERMTRREASEYLRRAHGVSRTPATLAKLAVVGGGPAFRKVGRRAVVYDRHTLDQWAEALVSPERKSTSGCPSSKNNN